MSPKGPACGVTTIGYYYVEGNQLILTSLVNYSCDAENGKEPITQIKFTINLKDELIGSYKAEYLDIGKQNLIFKRTKAEVSEDSYTKEEPVRHLEQLINKGAIMDD